MLTRLDHEHFTDLVDLAAERLGGTVLVANDEFFAPKENLLKPATPVSSRASTPIAANGWTAGRRAVAASPVTTGASSASASRAVRGVVVDTCFFKGNYPEQCSIEACSVDGAPTPRRSRRDARWSGRRSSAVRTPRRRQNPFAIVAAARITHLRLNIYPDGGVARLRVYGEPVRDPASPARRHEDLAAMKNGGLVVACSDMFFGHRHNLILPGRSTHMGDGWETKRRRGPGHDWIVVRLAPAARSAGRDRHRSLQGQRAGELLGGGLRRTGSHAGIISGAEGGWTRCSYPSRSRQTPHRFDVSGRPATHARLSIYPDGGIARLRLFGSVAT